MTVRMYWIKTGQTLGTWSDDSGEPRGDTSHMDTLLNHLAKTRDQRFAYYAGGYSKGMWATDVVKS